MNREVKDFWTYDEVLAFFNYMANDLSYAELNLLVRIMQCKLFFKKHEKERTDNNV